MKKLALMVAVAISTVVVAQRPLRKVIVETSSNELYSYGSFAIDSVYRGYTFCEKEMYAEMGLETSDSVKFWDYEYDFFDTLTYSSNLSERYVFDFRKGTVKYLNGSTRGKIQMTGFTYTGPEKYSDESSTEGYIFVYTKDKNGNSGSYTIYFDSNSLTYSPASELFEADFKRKEYKVTKVTRK
jgi:hypothetical protein